MQQVTFPDLEVELKMRLKRLREPAQHATFLDIRRRDQAVGIIVADIVSFLTERHYRVVTPSIVASPVLSSGHGWGPAPGRWGTHEPEPGSDSVVSATEELERAGQLSLL